MKYLLFFLIVLFLFSYWQHKLPPTSVTEMIKGIVSGEPQELADAAGVELETYSLARCAQSEVFSDRAKIAVMYACKNHADNCRSH